MPSAASVIDAAPWGQQRDKVLVAGIDPGQKGGIAIVDKISERLVMCLPLPYVNREVNKKTRLRLDYGALDDLLVYMCDTGVVLTAIENVGAGFGASGRELGEGIGAIRMSMHIHEMRWESVPVSRWKKEMAAPADKTESFFRAQMIFSKDRDMMLGPKNGKHDGKAEAAMIALYAARKLVT